MAVKGSVRERPARSTKAEQAPPAGLLGAELNAIATISALHGRRLANRRKRPIGPAIDHLIVAPSGVWLVDAKTHYGPPEVRRTGGILTPLVEQLFINNRERTGLIETLAQQVSTVERMLAGHYPGLPVRGALCLLETELPWIEERIAGIPLVDVPGLRRLLTEPGDLDKQARIDVAAVLADHVASS